MKTYAIICFSLRKPVIFEDLCAGYARSNDLNGGSAADSSFLTSYLRTDGSLTFCVERSMKTVLWTTLAYLNDSLQRLFAETLPVVSRLVTNPSCLFIFGH